MKKVFIVLCLVTIILTLTVGAKNENILLTIDLSSGKMTAVRSGQSILPDSQAEMLTFIHPVFYTDESMKKRIEPVSSSISGANYTCYINDGGKLDSLYVIPPALFVKEECEPMTINLYDESIPFVIKTYKDEKYSHYIVEVDIKPIENGMKAYFNPEIYINGKKYSGVSNFKVSNKNLIDGIEMKYNVPQNTDIKTMELVIDCMAVKTADILPQKVIIE